MLWRIEEVYFCEKAQLSGVLWVRVMFGGDLVSRCGVREGLVGNGIEVAGSDDLKAWCGGQLLIDKNNGVD